MILALLRSPVGRWGIVLAVLAALAMGWTIKVARDARQEERAERAARDAASEADTIRRIRDALDDAPLGPDDVRERLRELAR